MSLPKLFFAISLLLFGAIGILAFMKRSEKAFSQKESLIPPALEVPAKEEVNLTALQSIVPRQGASIGGGAAASVAALISQFDDDSTISEKEDTPQQDKKNASRPVVIEHDDAEDILKGFFSKPSTCPIVETIRYKSRVHWKPKKSAWLVDYSHHYKTPLEFMYRSMNGLSADSESQSMMYSENPVPVSEGIELNVFRRDMNFHFYVVISFASTRLRLYYILPDEKKAVFVKSYPVCLGRKESQKPSGSLTPFGLYQLGTKVMVFQPNMIGPYKGKRVELIQVFGTRWIPFEREVDTSACTEPAKGFGIHGTPLKRTSDGQLVEDRSSIGKYESDGCIRLNKKDIEELYSLISMRRAYIEIVPDFAYSRLMKGQI